jgi:hypothetical protein
MRISSAALLVLLAACSQGATEAPAADPDNLIECAMAGAAAFSRECEVEHAEEDGAPILIVRHPDGSFRRFTVTDDGYGLATADGAQRAAIGLHGKQTEVTVGADRYRFSGRVTDVGAR